VRLPPPESDAEHRSTRRVPLAAVSSATANGRSAALGSFLRFTTGVSEWFLVRGQTSPRALLWQMGHAALLLPLLLMPQSRRYRVWRDGQELRLVFVGREERVRPFMRRLSVGGAPVGSPTRRGTVALPRTLRGLDADLIAAEVHPWLAGAFRRHGWLILPEFVRWKGPLAKMPPAAPSKSLRTDLLRVARGGYTLEQSAGTSEDWREFRDRMVVPYARERFGADAWIASPTLMGTLRREGRILFLREGGERVAGACAVCCDGVVWVPVLGVAGGDMDTMRNGALAAIYALTLEWAKTAGMQHIDFGRTSASHRDGVARYKRKWGLSPEHDPLSPLIALRVDESRPELRTELERESLVAHSRHQ
jgi:Acetyltransferase (GNAT) domain